MATTITANGINFPDGSASAPSIGGTDTNTGLFTGSDLIGFATGGTERLRIEADGQIQIGLVGLTGGNDQALTITEPGGSANVLELATSNASGRINFSRNLSSTLNTTSYIEWTEPGAQGTGELRFGTSPSSNNPTERLRITSHGQIAIRNNGTTSQSSNLIVYGDADNSDVAIFSGGDWSRGLKISTAASGNNDALVIFDAQNADNGCFSFKTHGDERLRITSDGKVGIGTASPVNNVHLSKVNAGGDVSLRITNATNQNSGSTASLYFTTSPSVDFNTAYIQAVRDGGKLNFGYATNSPTVCMQVSTGVVGIGTTSPDRLLHIEGTQPYFRLTDTATGPSNGEINGMIEFETRDSNNPGVANNIRSELVDNTNGASTLYFSAGTPTTIGTKMEIQHGGDVKINNGNLIIGTAGKGIDFSATSDASGMTSEVLDNYEEGSFTMFFWVSSTSFSTPPVMSTNNCRYTKIGNKVTFAAYIAWNAAAAGGSGSLYLGGLPYSVNNNSAYGVVNFGWYNTGGGFAANEHLTGYLNNNSGNIILLKQAIGSSGGRTYSALPCTAIHGTTGTFGMSGTYIANG